MDKIRQPIVTVVGHVDHGKTSILDCFRGTSVQEKEEGGITQKISFTKYSLDQMKVACPLIEKNSVKLEIPGYLFIDTPGHAAFTNLRKRGGSLADLAILVVSIKEGIKPQTAEVLQILRANKTPFLIALNKVDNISGWKDRGNIKDSIDMLPMHARQEFDEALLTFQGSLREHGFESELYYEMDDFTKKIAIVPCSARFKCGIPELILVLCGLCQKFLRERLKLNNVAKGVVLEIKKERGVDVIESIIYDGILKEGSEIVVATFNDPIVTKVRAIEEILPLSNKYESVKDATAATGVRLHLKEKNGIVSGMPFQAVEGNVEKIKTEMKKEVSGAINLDKQGVIIKADSLGSLEALLFLLKQENIQVVSAGVGLIGKSDIIRAKTNLEINPLDAVIVGFNTEIEEELNTEGIKILTNPVIYKLIDDLKEWRIRRQKEIEKERMLGMASICKVEILNKYVFRNSNPAIFGIKILAGKLRVGLPMIDETGEEVARVKSIQADKHSVDEASEGMELALALPGIAFDRRLGDRKFLYVDLSEKQIRELKKNKDLLSASELKVIQEIIDIKKFVV